MGKRHFGNTQPKGFAARSFFPEWEKLLSYRRRRTQKPERKVTLLATRPIIVCVPRGRLACLKPEYLRK